MNACELNLDKIIYLLENFKKKKIHVVGDTIIDSLTECTMLGASGKTPTLSVQFQNQTDFCWWCWCCRKTSGFNWC